MAIAATKAATVPFGIVEDAAPRKSWTEGERTCKEASGNPLVTISAELGKEVTCNNKTSQQEKTDLVDDVGHTIVQYQIGRHDHRVVDEIIVALNGHCDE